jgi:hypothetical protein
LEHTRSNFTTAADGILVAMDGVAPFLTPPIPELNVTGYMLAAMTGFLAFLIFFGCILICAQAGLISAHPDDRGRIILFAGGRGARNVTVRIMQNGLLTSEQVLGLEEQEYQKAEGEEEEESRCCAICLDEFEDKEKVRVLPCRHEFHENCLVPWLTERHSSCPLCKFDVLEHIISKERDQTEVSTTNDTNNDAVLASIWRQLRLLGGWTLLNVHEESGSASGQDSDEEGAPASEIEMEVTLSNQEIESNLEA